ncbi:MAG: hypothetical protein PHN38_09715 [Sulfurospirillaceae bacterium]|nr:hypothetical protein [Sulfurospirillaceae bacterium]
MKSFYYDLSGGLNTAATKTDLGLATQKVFWAEAQNVEVYKNKGIIRQNGNVLAFQSPLNKPVFSLYGYEIDGKEIFLYSCNDGYIYCYDSVLAVSTLVYSQFTSPENVRYTRFLSGVVISNGVDDPIYFNHLTPTSPKACNAVNSAGNSIRGHAITAYKGRLWMAMAGTLYFSALGRYNDWATVGDAGYISNFHSDIDEITALAPYKDYLAIYKLNNTFLLSGSSQEDFAIQKFADKGALNQGMVLNVDNKQYFFNGGVFSLEQVGILSQISLGADISLIIKPEFNLYNFSSSFKGVAIHYEQKSQVWFFCPTSSNVYLSTVLIYDYVNKSWTKRAIPQEITCAASLNGYVYTGSSSGEVFLEDSGHTFNSEPISFLWKSPFFALGEPNLRKCVEDFYLLLDDNYDNNFKFSTFKNYDASAEDDRFQLASTDFDFLIWDSDDFVWADDSVGNLWTSLGEGVYKAEITQSNYSVQLAISGDALAESFALIGLEFKEIYYD